MNKEYANGFFDYLNKLYEFNKSNNIKFCITPEMVYSVLIDYGVMEKEDIEPLFNIWIERFKSRPGISVFRSENFKYFCQFVNGNFDAHEAIKIYVPLKRRDLDANVTKIFDFIRSNNIMHYSKVSKKVRNDNVVIRVSNKKDAITIINFINSDNSIKKHLNPVSPLTFNYNGVGVTRDGDASYNFEVCRAIAACLNRGMKLNVDNFANYLKQKGSYEVDSDRKMIYEICSRIFKGITFDDICKMENKVIGNKTALFEAMRVTKEKYGIDQVRTAIFQYVCNSNPNYFSRGVERNRDYRLELCSSLSPNDVMNIINNTIGKSDNINDAIIKFVNSVYADDIARIKEVENEAIDNYLKELKLEYIGFNCDLVSLIKSQKDSSKAMIQRKIIEQVYPNLPDEEIKILFKSGEAFNIIANLVKIQIFEKEDVELYKTVKFYLKYLEEMCQVIDYEEFVKFISVRMNSKENINGIDSRKVFRTLFEYLYQDSIEQGENIEQIYNKGNDAEFLARLIKDEVESKKGQNLERKV